MNKNDTTHRPVWADIKPIFGSGLFTLREEMILEWRLRYNETRRGVAQDFRITREQVRHIEEQALKKWRNRYCPHCDKEQPKGMTP